MVLNLPMRHYHLWLLVKDDNASCFLHCIDYVLISRLPIVVTFTAEATLHSDSLAGIITNCSCMSI